MKKFMITLLVAAMPIAATFAQGNAFSQFENKDDISVIIINDDMISLFGEVLFSQKDIDRKKTEQYLEEIKTLTELRAFVTSDKKHVKHMKKAVKNFLDDNALEELCSISEKGRKIKLYMRTGTNEPSHMKQLLVFTENLVGDEVALVYFSGDVDLEKDNSTVLNDTTN